MHPYLGELIGTAILVLLGNGVVANVVLDNTKGHGAGWMVITMGWGMGVFVAVFCVMDISGAHINPAVTVGLAAAGEFGWDQVAGFVAAQMAGAILGAGLVFAVYRDHYKATADADAKLATFCTAPNIRNLPRNLLGEAVGTMVLAYAVLMASAPTFEHLGEGGAFEPSAKLGLGAIGALPVGLLVLAIGLSLGGTTGYAINPARDLGPRIAHALLPVPGKRDNDWGYAWVPVVGPLLGGVLAAALYRWLGGAP